MKYPDIKCEVCGGIFTSDQLLVKKGTDPKMIGFDETYLVCPVCKTDEYLTNKLPI